MYERCYRSMPKAWNVNRRDFLKVGGAVGAGILLRSPHHAWAQDSQEHKPPEKPQTNLADYLEVPRTENSLPGPFPGRVVELHDPGATLDGKPAPEVVQAMFAKGMTELTGKPLPESCHLFFSADDVIGIKVNPVGAGLISTRLEVVDAVVTWLTDCGIPRRNLVIWDRFDYMLADAGFTPDRYPGIRIAGLQTMDEAAMDPESSDDSGWLDADGNHRSMNEFDQDMYYWVDMEAPQDQNYLNQHVFNGQQSYFGKLVTRELTKIINIPVFKNTGNGISMATKNIGYGAICNTGRLHRPLFFDVCTEVLAFPCVRDKLVLNITDGLVGQYDGGPMPNASFTYSYNTLFFATDPFALDMTCHNLMVTKRKEMQVKVNDHPRFTDYLRYAEKLELGVADPDRIDHIRV